MISRVVTEDRIRVSTHYDVTCGDQNVSKGVNDLSSKGAMHGSFRLNPILVNGLEIWLNQTEY